MFCLPQIANINLKIVVSVFHQMYDLSMSSGRGTMQCRRAEIYGTTRDSAGWHGMARGLADMTALERD